jgi:NADH dehydrogenase
LTIGLPIRGNVQVRVEQLTPNSATLVTLAGHPLAGAIRFLAEQRGDLLRFEVQVYDRPANLADWFAMRAVGDGLQARSWESLVQAMEQESGGAAVTPVSHEETFLDEEQAERVEAWVKDLVVERKQAGHMRPRARPERASSESVETEAAL